MRAARPRAGPSGTGMIRRATAWAPGTWGELVQGSVGGEPFMVTCPVNLHSYAAADAASSADVEGLPGGPPGLWQGPAGRPRTQAALTEIPGAGRVRIRSTLRPGAGMASSTADLCAAMAAASALSGRCLTPAELFAACLRLEPTDGLMFPGIALVDHLHGSRVELLGAPPPLGIVGVDPGGTVATASFNCRADLAAANRRKEPAVREALAMATTAVAAGDPVGLAAAATLSARAHQGILPNPLWEPATDLGPACGALGISVAHSGTVVGFLFDLTRTDLRDEARWLGGRLGLSVRCLKLIGGGVTVRCSASRP